jgi:tuftelin-interacting protein 11
VERGRPLSSTPTIGVRLTHIQVFDSQEWENLILKYIVPKLASALRDDFRINPASQDIEPFRRVMAWSTIIRKSIFSQILETEFFPRWLDILHQWLTQPSANFDEIADWYKGWKNEFPSKVLQMDGVQRGFMFGQQLMYDATTLSRERRGELPKPNFGALLKNGGQSPRVGGAQDSPHKPKTRAPRTQEITFKMLVEERAAEHNLLFIPTGRVHEKSQVPLYRVSNGSGGVGGKNGIEVFIMDDAVWLVEGEKYRAVSLDDMVVRAAKGKGS